MNVLITGPNLDDTKQVGGIITVINTILSVITVDHDVFVRSPEQDQKSSLAGKVKWLGKIFSYIQMNLSSKYDVIHVHTAMNKSAMIRDYLWVFLGRFFKAKVLLHVHGGKYLFEKPSKGLLLNLAHKLFNRSDAIIVLSDKEKKALLDLYSVKKPISILENAINLQEIPPLSGEQQHQARHTLQLIFIGRITESKGIHDIVEAIDTMSEAERKRFRLDLYGEGELAAFMQERMKTLLGDRFEYHGIVSGEGKWQALQKADIFLLPSRYGEGLPMALLEAMALGKTVLTTNDASMGLVVQHGHNGYMVEKYQPKMIKDTLLKIAEMDQTEIEKIGTQAKVTVQEHFSAHRYIEKLESIYRQVSNTK